MKKITSGLIGLVLATSSVFAKSQIYTSDGHIYGPTNNEIPYRAETFSDKNGNHLLDLGERKRKFKSEEEFHIEFSTFGYPIGTQVYMKVVNSDNKTIGEIFTSSTIYSNNTISTPIKISESSTERYRVVCGTIENGVEKELIAPLFKIE